MPLICIYRVTKRINSELYWEQGRGCEWVSDFLRIACKAVSTLPAVASKGWGFSRSERLIREVKAWGDEERAAGQRSWWLKDVYLLSIWRKLKLLVWIFVFQKNVLLLCQQLKGWLCCPSSCSMPRRSKWSLPVGVSCSGAPSLQSGPSFGETGLHPRGGQPTPATYIWKRVLQL